MTTDDNYINQLMELNESISDTLTGIDNELSLGMESNSNINSALKYIWNQLVRLINYLMRFFGAITDSTKTLSYSLDRVETKLKRIGGKSPKNRTVILKNEINQLLINNKIPNTPSDFIRGIKDLHVVLDKLNKFHVPNVKKTAVALSKAYGDKTKDTHSYVMGIGAAAQLIRLDQLATVIRANVIRGDKRFSRNIPVFKGPDMLGNKSIFIDIPLKHATGYVSDIERVKLMARSRITFGTSKPDVVRFNTDVEVGVATQDQLKAMVQEMRNVISVINMYPKDMMVKEVESMEKSLSEINFKFDTANNNVDVDYLKVATRMLRSFSSWVANPHTQLIADSLHTCRSMITMVNKQIKNY